MHKSILPITIEVVHENELDCLIVEGEMKIDFGPWKKGDKRCLTFNFDKGIVLEYAENSEVIVAATEFRLEPNEHNYQRSDL